MSACFVRTIDSGAPGDNSSQLSYTYRQAEPVFSAWQRQGNTEAVDASL